MADKVDKPKKNAKAKKDEKGVLAALPSTRPERIGSRRAAAATSATPAQSAPTAKPTTTAKRAATGKRKPAARAKPAAASAKRAAGATSARERTDPRPRPVSEGAPGIGTGGHRDQESSESGRPSTVEIASTAVKAAGEVAQFGLALGGKALKRVVDRLPKP